MLRLLLSALWICVLAGAVAGAEVNVAGVPQGISLNDDFTVKVRPEGKSKWVLVPIYLVKVDEVRGTKHHVEHASMVTFDFSGKVDIEVTYNKGKIDSARVRPLSYDIPFTIEGNTLQFSLEKPANLAVEVNGDIFHNLHLFANPLDTFKVDKKNPDLIYFAEELSKIVCRSAKLLNVEVEPDGAREIAQRSRGTPRIANRLLRRVRDYAEVKHGGVITRDVADGALRMLGVDAKGLDGMDQRFILSIIEKFGGGPVGIDNLAAAVGEERDTLEDVVEPYLIQQGFIQRTPRGRVATEASYRHFGYTQSKGGQSDLF